MIFVSAALKQSLPKLFGIQGILDEFNYIQFSLNKFSYKLFVFINFGFFIVNNEYLVKPEHMEFVKPLAQTDVLRTFSG